MKKSPLLLPLLLLALSPLLAAQPAWLSEINLKKPGANLKLRPIQLTYDLSWNGSVVAGQTTFRFGFPDKRYPRNFIAQSYGSTTGLARNLFPFDFNFTSFLRTSDYRPQVFVAEETQKDQHKYTKTEFTKKGVSSTRKKTKLPSKEVSHSTSTFDAPFAIDAQSAVLWVRSLDLKKGEEAVFVVMPFKTPYLCRVTHLGNEVRSARRTVKYDLKLQKIDKETLELKTYDKLKSFVIWVSDDAERIPLEFRSKVFVGDVRAVLTSKSYL